MSLCHTSLAPTVILNPGAAVSVVGSETWISSTMSSFKMSLKVADLVVPYVNVL